MAFRIIKDKGPQLVTVCIDNNVLCWSYLNSEKKNIKTPEWKSWFVSIKSIWK